METEDEIDKSPMFAKKYCSGDHQKRKGSSSFSLRLLQCWFLMCFEIWVKNNIIGKEKIWESQVCVFVCPSQGF